MKGAGVCGVGVQITIHSLVSLTLHQLTELPVTAVGARRRMMVRASRALTTNAPCTRIVLTIATGVAALKPQVSIEHTSG